MTDSVVVETVENYANDFHMIVLGSVRPIICAKERVKKMRRHYYHDIEKILDWDEETKEKLIDLLVDICSAPTPYRVSFNYWMEEFEKKLEELKENYKIYEVFYRLKGYLDRIDPIQREQIIRTAINRIISHIETILRELIFQLSCVEKESLKEVFTISSLLRLTRNMLEEYLRSKNNTLIFVATYLILRFASYVRGRISLDDIQRDISICPRYLRSEQIPREVLRRLSVDVFKEF